MSTNRGYLVIPKLIEQPTWGGFYIAKVKGWSSKPFGMTKIGQSYELYAESHLSLATDTAHGDFTPEIADLPSHTVALDQLVSHNPQATLGMNNDKIFGGQMKTLIKFTQAKGNSFQIHVKPGTENTQWSAKPESWYYFEEGLATLGISDSSNLDAYKSACVTINTYMQSLSEDIGSGKVTIEDARAKAQQFIQDQNIYQYVNIVTVPMDAIVNLHLGGTHHSWEENEAKMPLGNVVYEVQVNEMDDVSTIRSFDKGKIKDDGTIRELQIDDYFTYLDQTPDGNDPAKHMSEPQLIDTKASFSIKQLFDTKYYKMQRVDMTAEFAGDHTKPHNETFHHLFVKEGTISYSDGQVDLTVGTGHSIFVPAGVLEYKLTPTSHKAVVLKTYV